MTKRVTDKTDTKTFHLANHLAKFPRVEDTAQVDLRYSTKFYEQTHRTPPTTRKGFFTKCFELFNPAVWSPAFWFALIAIVAVNGLVYFAIAGGLAALKAPLYEPNSILTVLRKLFILVAPAVLLVFHLCLNYRRRGPGRLIKAYWYASWTATFCLTALNVPLAKAASELKANQVNEYCFQNRDTKKCARYSYRMYKSSLRDQMLKLMPERRRASLVKLFEGIRKDELEARRRRLAEEANEETDEAPIRKPAVPKKVADARARLLKDSRSLAYSH